MDYKKLIKSRSIRLKILYLLSFIPDELMIKLQYYIKTGRRLNLKNPQRYSEKIQWYKLFYRDSLMARCVDKYEVRKYVESCKLKGILNKCYGVYESIDEIDINRLPKSFVMKDTLGGGGNSVLLIKDKEKTDWKKCFKILEDWIATPIGIKHVGREWAYERKAHLIIIEEMLFVNNDGDLPDYKFFCFGGTPKFVIIDKDRFIDHKRNFYTIDKKKINVDSDHIQFCEEYDWPENYHDMVTIAKKLSENFPFVRVDLYNVAGKIIFGELTFYPWSGYVQFNPDAFDYELGNYFILPEKKKIMNDF